MQRYLTSFPLLIGWMVPHAAQYYLTLFPLSLDWKLYQSLLPFSPKARVLSVCDFVVAACSMVGTLPPMRATVKAHFWEYVHLETVMT